MKQRLSIIIPVWKWDQIYLEKTLNGENSRETVIKVLEHQVSRMILLDGIFGGQGGAAQQYHKHNKAVKKRLGDKPMNAHSHPEIKFSILWKKFK